MGLKLKITFDKKRSVRVQQRTGAKFMYCEYCGATVEAEVEKNRADDISAPESVHLLAGDGQGLICTHAQNNSRKRRDTSE